MPGWYSTYSVCDSRQEQMVSSGEVIMISATSVCFIHSQTLEEDNMWLYTFKFLAGGMSRSSAGSRVDELWKARIKVQGIQNANNQYYNISDEKGKLGMVYGSMNDDGSSIYPQGNYTDVVMGVADAIVTAMSDAKNAAEPFYQVFPTNVLGWIWTGASLAGEIVHFIINEKENDFEGASFYRELDASQASDLGMYWEMKIEVPPGSVVSFSVSSNIWSTSGEVLEGTPIICRIQAPTNLITSNDNLGVSFSS